MIGMEDTGDVSNTGLTSKKRPRRCRVTDARKNYDIKHTRLAKIADAEDLSFSKCSYGEQNVYLAGLIRVCEVAFRWPRKEEDEADFHSASYKCTSRVKRDGSAVDISICYKAMLALHVITAQWIQNIQKSLKSTGTSPKDCRGRHTNRLQMLPNDTTGKKEADDVALMLWDFICNHLDDNVEVMEIYSDSCCGQNKNYTIFRFLHYVVHYTKHLKKVTMTFPECGHSYVECDSNMALINQKAIVETQSGWNYENLTARVKLQPFKVVSCESQCVFLAWTQFLAPLYATQCPLATRPIKELVITQDHPRLIQDRLTYNGTIILQLWFHPKRSDLHQTFNLVNLDFLLVHMKSSSI
ncbi:hypothetical protein PR048_013459 [Dryococelus australis]|uniref:DUF7869 domain-containing protein n=1 Tax=Dryococelus australis TaxID=614101 RepID=A0ABQ9HT24_9NEOP|nr:hypothetical protein PR048_013459 [Dryococelus australis]